MKYIALLLVVLALLGASSCKKDYTCVCTSYTPGVNDTSFVIQAANSTQAVNNCYSQILGHTSNCVYQ
jgi:hypothetical protein